MNSGTACALSELREMPTNDINIAALELADRADGKIPTVSTIFTGSVARLLNDAEMRRLPFIDETFVGQMGGRHFTSLSLGYRN